MMWLVEYLFGIFLGYYALSPRLRGFINGCITRLFTRARETENEQGEPIAIDGDKLILSTRPYVLTDKKQVQVNREELDKWMRNNPDLQKLNEAKK